jgi:hypothetical protein
MARAPVNVNSPGAFPLDNRRQADDTELLKHAELVEVVPALDQFPFLDTDERHSAELDVPAGRRETQPLASVSAAGTPPNRNHVAFGNEVVDMNNDVRVRVAVCGMELFELCCSVQIRAETVNHGVICKHLVDAGYTALIPNLLEPSPNQSFVLK